MSVQFIHILKMSSFFAFRLSLFVLLLFPLSLSAKEGKTEEAIATLDATIARKAEYQALRQHRTDSLKQIAQRAKGPQLVETYKELFTIFSRVQTDSALLYLNLLERLPKNVKNSKDLDIYISIGRAEIYAVMGQYDAAQSLLKSISIQHATPETRLYYYHTCRTVYGWMAEFSSVEDFQSRLLTLTDHYRDSIISCQDASIGSNIVRVDKMLTHGIVDSAIVISLADLEKALPNERPYIYFNIAEAYRQKGDADLYKYYLALTATADIQHGITEYMALPTLAQLAYEEGDLKRAYDYMVCSMEDANYCQARLRAVEVSNAFPIIDRAYKDYQSKQHKMERIFTYTLVLLALLLLAAIFYLRRQMKKLASTRRQLARTNSQLETTNQQLNAANQQLGLANTQLHEVNEGLVRTDQIKEEYIAYYLGRCRNYIDSFNRFRLDMLRLAKNRQTDDLLRSLKSDELFQSQQEQFYVDFDEAFINIHPHFVENFNALLRPDEQIQPKRGELLTTELRIFALIRLGMTDTAEIAHFLNYSLTTIYNYRSRIRNASIYSKEEFEKRLMLL